MLAAAHIDRVLKTDGDWNVQLTSLELRETKATDRANLTIQTSSGVTSRL